MGLTLHQIRELDGSHVGHVLAMAPSTFKTLASQCWSLVLVRRSALYVMKTKPRLHDGRVTIDLDKNRLVEIPHSGRNHQTMDSQGFC